MGVGSQEFDHGAGEFWVCFVPHIRAMVLIILNFSTLYSEPNKTQLMNLECHGSNNQLQVEVISPGVLGSSGIYIVAFTP
jgi:hypothetical protein